jgi:hypothetical protein
MVGPPFKKKEAKRLRVILAFFFKTLNTKEENQQQILPRNSKMLSGFILMLIVLKPLQQLEQDEETKTPFSNINTSLDKRSHQKQKHKNQF